MTQWQPAATRGNLSVDVITLRRALADGIVRGPSGTTWTLDGDTVEVTDERDGRSRGNFSFMVRMHPDGSDPYLALFEDAEAVRGFLKDMEPRQTRLLVAESEIEEAIWAAIQGQIH